MLQRLPSQMKHRGTGPRGVTRSKFLERAPAQIDVRIQMLMLARMLRGCAVSVRGGKMPRSFPIRLFWRACSEPASRDGQVAAASPVRTPAQ